MLDPYAPYLEGKIQGWLGKLVDTAWGRMYSLSRALTLRKR
jgi:hypothetical protein